LSVFLAGGAAVLATSGLFKLTDAAMTAANILLHTQRYWLGFTFNLVVIASYIVVTALFYDLFRAVSRYLSLQARSSALWAVRCRPPQWSFMPHPGLYCRVQSI
jgi:hypothetical protein